MLNGRWIVLSLASLTALAAAGCANGKATPVVPSQGPSRVECDQGAIVRGDRTQPTLAVIFTGGSYGEGAGAILAALKERGVHAGFFLTGDFLADADRRGSVERMIADRHYVGPHSHSHPLYCSWENRAQTLITADFFRADLEHNIAELRGLGALPRGQAVLFIPPYEWFNADQVRWARDMGVVTFNFTPGSGSNRDWIPEGQRGFVSSADIAAGILDFERTAADGMNGFILLLHLGSQRADKMHLQVPHLLDELQARGYRFVRIDELLMGAHCEIQHDD